jgi:hypothetical protein
MLLLVSVQLGGAGCSRRSPAPPPPRSERALPAAVEKRTAVAPLPRTRPQPVATTEPRWPVLPVDAAPAYRAAGVRPSQSSSAQRSYEAFYPERTPDGRIPMWRQRAKNY